LAAAAVWIYRRNRAPPYTTAKPDVDDDDVQLLSMANCPDQSPLPWSKFCGTCGEQLAGPVAFCPGCGARK